MDDESEHGTPGPSKILDDFPDDTIKILLATDNHIGYLERDPVRGQDSINTFREILQLARKHDVDFILLAGDLFHENKPSRNCLYSTIALLREYTMGDNPVQIELLSDPDEGKADGFTFPAINYEDPNFNVGIPVFSIHGNHDDPQGAGAEGALCALDVLSVTGLLNYMGKIDLPMSDAEAPTTGIAVRPVLLRKGNTHLGMYGIGNVKDQRMHFELRSNRVRMFMPQNKDDWFNILLLHQNRVKHGPQESVPEGMFDDIPEPVAGKNYYICQPGSSVATSLADGEAIEKHVALVKVQGKDFQLTPLPLRTVRPFVIEEVAVSDLASEYNFELNDQISINKYLKIKVNELIESANAQSADRNALAVSQGEEDMPPMLPLVRLKVDTTGVSDMSNPIRFGQEFQGRVANPRDLLVFTRSKRAARTGKVSVDQPELSIDDPDLTSSEKLAKVRVATLVKEFLAAQEPQLLGENGMSDAIQMFVEKDDIHAIQTHVGKTLKSMMKGVKANGGEPGELDEEDLDEVLTKAKEQQEKEYLENTTQNKPSKGKGKAKADESDAASEDSMMMDVDVGRGGGGGGSDFDSDEPAPPPKKKAPAKKAPAKAAPAKKAPAKKAPAKGRGRRRAAVLSQSQAPAKKAPAKKKAPAASAAKQSQLSFAPAGRSSTRAAATKAKGKMVIDSDSD
ncbi:DNA repair exonuclease [Hymenopellis radicata]|nr:DNA repair exonuclease [Hymenopellis radicata]